MIAETNLPKQRNSQGAGPRDSKDVVIVGGGQAGLAIGYYLKQAGLDFIILDAAGRVGDSWRKRWDSLRLFTQARFDQLPGMPFPADKRYLPTKDEMADYLEAYAQRFELPVQLNTRVRRVTRDGKKYLVETEGQTFEADNVVSAMSTFQIPWTPQFDGQLDPDIRQLHSFAYRNPDQLHEGAVLIVGAGNSGAEIALDVARRHKTLLAGRHPGHLPFRIESTPVKYLIVPFVLRILFHRLLTVDTPMGRKKRKSHLNTGTELIRVKPADIAAAKIEQVPRLVAIEDGRPRLEDGRIVDVANIIWCTGFRPNFSWIDLPVFHEVAGTVQPKQYRGVVEEMPGFYFAALSFLYAASSEQIHGAMRDAEFVAKHIVERSPVTAADRNATRAVQAAV